MEAGAGVELDLVHEDRRLVVERHAHAVAEPLLAGLDRIRPEVKCPRRERIVGTRRDQHHPEGHRPHPCILPELHGGADSTSLRAMPIERTFSIIKPDAVAKNAIGQITAKLEAAGLRVIASRMVRLTEVQAKAFYAVHKARPFYSDLVKFMTEGPVVVQVLEGDNAIMKNREVMGATDPAKAAAGTI